MDLQRQMNIDFVMEHEKLYQNVNAFWGPKSAPFTYTTSKWGRESSCEVLLDSDDSSYQTLSIVGLLHLEPAYLVRGKPRVGETLPVLTVPSPLLPLSQ